MKKLRILSGVIVVITAFLLSGCYTQLAMKNNPSGNYGYNSDNGQNNGNYQTPADSAYGSQYEGQTGVQQDSTNYYGSGTTNNYYLNSSPYWNDWYYNPSFSLGFYWDGYYNPYYWNSFNNWGCYFCYFNPPVLYSSYYYNPYYSSFYYPYYYGYYGGYYTRIVNRSKGTYRLRNNDGLRGEGGRGSISGSSNGTLASFPSSSGRNVTSRSSSRTTTVKRSEPYNTRNNQNIVAAVPVRVRSAGYTTERNSTSRGTYRPQYRSNRQSSSSTYQNNKGESRTYNNARSEGRSVTRSSSSSTRRTYSPPQRTYSPPHRSYSPPARSYSPPQRRSYSPPARSYSAPRSYSPPARASSGGGRGSSNSGGRRR